MASDEGITFSGFDPATDVRLDPRNLRGLAHPIRMRLRAELVENGPATATQLAARTGESSGTTSYHLRKLAEYGFAVDEPSLGNGRERYWRSLHRSTWFDVPVGDLDTSGVVGEYMRAFARVQADRVLRFADSIEAAPELLGADWARAAAMSDSLLDLTVDEAEDLQHRLHELLAPSRHDRGRSPPWDPAGRGPVPGSPHDQGQSVSVRQRGPLAGLLAAVGVSTLGTRMSFLAVPWLVLTTTRSATLTGVVAFAAMFPYVAVQATGGPAIDRIGARPASIGTDIIAAAFTAAVPLLWAFHALPTAALAALLGLAGAARGAGERSQRRAGARRQRTGGRTDRTGQRPVRRRQPPGRVNRASPRRRPRDSDAVR